MSKYINADKILYSMSNDLPYKGSVRRVLIQAEEEDVIPVTWLIRWADESYVRTRFLEGMLNDWRKNN